METELKHLTVLKMDDKEEEVAELLEKLRYGRNLARVLACMTSEPDKTSNILTSYELQQATGISQPEISYVMNTLEKLGWLKETTRSHAGKGRPHKIYSLTITMEDIIAKAEEGVVEFDQIFGAKISKLRGVST